MLFLPDGKIIRSLISKRRTSMRELAFIFNRQSAIAYLSLFFLFNLFSQAHCQAQSPEVKKAGAPIISTAGKPTVMPLPVLKNEKGDIIKDRNGNSFVLGNAGGYTPMQNYNTEQGLALSTIGGAYCDRLGNLWFGTQGGGISKFDGKTFTNYTTVQGLANNSVMGIAEDIEGNFWFATYGGGVSKYDGRRFTTFTEKDGLPNKLILSVLADREGNVWFGTQGGGICKYDRHKFITYTTANGLANNTVWSIAEDKGSNIWIGLQGGSLNKYNRQSFITFDTTTGLPGKTIRSIYFDKQGIMWLGTNGGGLCKYDGRSFRQFTITDGLGNNYVLSIQGDNAGNLWMGTNGGGVTKYDGKHFITYTTAQGLSNNIIWSIILDHAGFLWFGTYGGGVDRFDGSYSTYNKSHGVGANIVYSICQDKKGYLWFGTDGGGVSKFDGVSFSTYGAAQGLKHDIAYCVSADKSGNIWIGTQDGGVYKFDGTYFSNYTTSQGLANNTVISIMQDHIGNIWFGTQEGGVTKFDGVFMTTYTVHNGLAGNTVRNISEDKNGLIWFSTEGGGVSKFDGSVFTNYNIKQGLANNSAYCTTQDVKGNIWIATQEGLSFLAFNNAEDSTLKNPIITYKSQEGLPDNFITQVQPDNKGRIVIGTNKGVAVIPTDATSPMNVYNIATGYPINDINVGNHSLFFDSSGMLWAGTGNDKNALVRFDYNSAEKESHIPSLVIQGVKIQEQDINWYMLAHFKVDSSISSQQELMIFGRPLSVNSRDSIKRKYSGIEFSDVARFYPLPQDLVLPYANNSITFQYAAIEPGLEQTVSYQYLLDGYDKEWSPVTTNTTAVFGNMYEGQYTFRLRARIGTGQWSKPVTYTFRVLPPWYRHWIAYLLYLIAAILFVWAIIWYRERSSQEQKRVLENKVVVRTRELSEEKDRSESLLLNILPANVAEELKISGESEARLFQHVTVLFTDFVNFTGISEVLTPTELVAQLHSCFTGFDKIIERNGLEKIKTIGDAYLAVCGLPEQSDQHAVKAVSAAKEIMQFMREQKEALGGNVGLSDIRLGIHSGEVVAGIVGVKKFAYDIWGDTVNTAARMEQHGEKGKINISGSTYELVKNNFICIHRGKIKAKNKGDIDMYFVEDTT